jgi:dienelactone hydrolase
MAIVRQTIVYKGPGGPFEGVAAYDDEVETHRPGVLVLPNVLGQKEADNAYAEYLARLGYVALAADVFGQGKRTTRESENQRLHMDPLNADRGLLRERLRASLDALRDVPFVDPAKVAAVGFCFGGKCVLDMARSGLDFLGGVSIHGVYERPAYANVASIKAKLLVLHGWDDPLGPPSSVEALARELTEGGADWQFHAYGQAGHAFTDEGLKGRATTPGVAYDERADRRSRRAVADFLAELFL